MRVVKNAAVTRVEIEGSKTLIIEVWLWVGRWLNKGIPVTTQVRKHKSHIQTMIGLFEI